MVDSRSHVVLACARSWLSAAPARRSPRCSAARCSAVRALFTPLLPDDYLELINPLWSTRELRGRIERDRARDRRRGDGRDQARLGVGGPRARPVPAHRRRRRRRPPLARLLADLRPGPPRRLHRDHAEARRGGQGLAVPRAPGAGRGRSCASAASRATSCCPTRCPSKLLFISAGSGDHADHEHAARPRPPRRAATTSCTCTRRAPPDDVIFGAQLRATRASATTASACTSSSPASDGPHRRPADLDELCPDWRERETFLSGPAEMLDALTEHWERARRPRPPAHGALPADHRRRRRARRGRHDPLPHERRRGAQRRHDSRSSSPARRPAPTLPFGCRDGHLPHLRRASSAPGRSATCAPARSTAARARWSAPASTPPRAPSRSRCEHRPRGATMPTHDREPARAPDATSRSRSSAASSTRSTTRSTPTSATATAATSRA